MFVLRLDFDKFRQNV